MSLVHDAEHIRYPRPDDIKCFLNVYQRATSGKIPPEQRKSYVGLVGSKNYTTRLGQLRRIAEFATTRITPPASKPAQPLEREVRPGIEVLFDQIPGGDGGLQPSNIATELRKEFQLLMQVYDSLGQRTAEALGVRRPEPREVRAASGPNFSYYVCPYIFSMWKKVFGKLLRLTWKTGNTADLLSQLDVGLLDFIVGYGDKNECGLPVQQDLQVAFSSLGFPSRMILGVHPGEPLWLRSKKDLNHNYTKYLEDKTAEISATNDQETAPKYRDLKSVRLEQIDFGKTKFIITRSLTQPPGLQEFLTQYGADRLEIQYVDSFDESIAGIRLQRGVGLLPEVYKKRPMINAFKLVPEDDFTRWMGAYYSTRFGLSEEAYRLLAFMEEYFKKFEVELRNGKPPRRGDPEFDGWCKEFRIGDNWHSIVEQKFPR